MSIKSASRWTPSASYPHPGPSHREQSPPASQDHGEKSGDDEHERQRQALPGHRPQRHPAGEDAEPHQTGSAYRLHGPPPPADQRPPDQHAADERPQRPDEPANGVGLAMAGTADRDEGNDADNVQHESQPDAHATNRRTASYTGRQTPRAAPIL